MDSCGRGYKIRKVLLLILFPLLSSLLEREEMEGRDHRRVFCWGKKEGDVHECLFGMGGAGLWAAGLKEESLPQEAAGNASLGHCRVDSTLVEGF